MKIIRNFLVVVLILTVIRMTLPIVLLAGFNYALKNKIEDYAGKAQDLDLAIFNGAFTLKDIHLEYRKKPEILKVDIDSVKCNLSWQDLFNKKVYAVIQINQLAVLITELPPQKQPQPEDLTFKEIRKKLAELKWSTQLNKFELRNASFKFIFPKAKIPFSVSNIDAAIYNLHFSPYKEWQLANFTLRGLLQGQGEFKLDGRIQPLALPPMADINFAMTDFDLKTLNGLMLEVLPLDITRGKLSAYIEGASEKNFSNGYAKIFFDDVDVVENKQKFKSGRHVLIEFGTAIGNWVLKNAKEKTLAVKVPFKIQHGVVDVKTSATIWSAFENKRNELERKLENSVSFAQNRDQSVMQ